MSSLADGFLHESERHQVTSRFKDSSNYSQMDFDVPTDQSVKLKESENKDKYLDLTRELNNYGAWMWQWYQL